MNAGLQSRAYLCDVTCIQSSRLRWIRALDDVEDGVDFMVDLPLAVVRSFLSKELWPVVMPLPNVFSVSVSGLLVNNTCRFYLHFSSGASLYSFGVVSRSRSGSRSTWL